MSRRKEIADKIAKEFGVEYMPELDNISKVLSGKQIANRIAKLTDWFVKELDKTEKAYGGCKKCYGKGYATVAYGTISSGDFVAGVSKSKVKNHIKFCSCERGKQLRQVAVEQWMGVK